MGLYDLSTRMENLREVTTMADITYLPSGLGVVKAAIRDLARLKKDWNIEILEDGKGRKVIFEDELSVYVPHQYWNEFAEIFDGELEEGEIGLGRYLKEALDADLERLRKELKPAVTELFAGSDFKAVDKATNLWRSRFGVTRYMEPGAVVSFEYREKDIQELISKLHKVYGEDKGNLELFLEAVRSKEPLNMFEVFKKYNFLYGARIVSRHHKVSMTFEATIDMSYMLAQSITAGDYDVILTLEEEGLDKGVKIVKNVIYPTEDRFTNRFLRDLKDVVADSTDRDTRIEAEEKGEEL